jgi:hypothetical protein
MSKNGPVNDELLKKMGEAFNTHNVNAVVDFFAEDGVFVMARGPEPYGRKLKGKREIKAFLTERFAKFKDMRWNELDRWYVANRAVTEWVVTGTSPSGEKVNLYGCDLFLFNDDGKIVKKDTYWKSNEKTI